MRSSRNLAPKNLYFLSIAFGDEKKSKSLFVQSASLMGFLFSLNCSVSLFRGRETGARLSRIKGRDVVLVLDGNSDSRCAHVA